MSVYELRWKKINWDNYYAKNVSYIEDWGILYATTEEKARENCPIDETQGQIIIRRIDVID